MTGARSPRRRTGRRAFFVGDLVDRGPNSPDVLRIVMDMAERGQAFSVIGNHDDKFMRHLKGRAVKLTHGLDRTVEQYAGEGDALRARTLAFLDTLPSHAWVDDGHLAVAHAGVREGMLGKQPPEGARFRPLWRQLRPPRRRRPARTLQLRRRLSRHGGGGLRPHAGRRARVAEQYDVHRHRLRVRRQPDGAALAGARAGLGAGARKRTPPCAALTACRPRARPARRSADLLSSSGLSRGSNVHPLLRSKAIAEHAGPRHTAGMTKWCVCVHEHHVAFIVHTR